MENQTDRVEIEATRDIGVEQPSAAPAEVEEQTGKKVTMPVERVAKHDLKFDLAAQIQHHRDPKSAPMTTYVRQLGAENVSRYNMPRGGVTDEQAVGLYVMQCLTRVPTEKVAEAISSVSMVNEASVHAFMTSPVFTYNDKKSTDVTMLTKRSDLCVDSAFQGRCFLGEGKGEYVDVYIDNTQSKPAPPAGYLVGVNRNSQPAAVAAAVRGALLEKLVPLKCTAEEFDYLQMRVVVRGSGGDGRSVAVRARGEGLNFVRKALGSTQRIMVGGLNVGFAQNPLTALALDKEIEPELALYAEHVAIKKMISVRYDSAALPLWTVDLNRMIKNLREASKGKATVVDLVQGNMPRRGGWRHLSVTVSSIEDMSWLFEEGLEDGMTLAAALFGAEMAQAAGEGQIVIEPWRQSNDNKQNDDWMSKSAASGGRGFGAEQNLDGFLDINSEFSSLTENLGITEEMRERSRGAATQAAMVDEMEEDTTTQLWEGMAQLDLSKSQLSAENQQLVSQLLTAQHAETARLTAALAREQTATLTTLFAMLQNSEQAQGQQNTEQHTTQAQGQQNTEQHTTPWTQNAVGLSSVMTAAPMANMPPRIPAEAPRLPCQLGVQPKTSALKRTATSPVTGNSPVRKQSSRGGPASANISRQGNNRNSQSQQNAQPPPSPPVIQRAPAQSEQNSASSPMQAG
jgi:hypothetical protein